MRFVVCGLTRPGIQCLELIAQRGARPIVLLTAGNEEILPVAEVDLLAETYEIHRLTARELGAAVAEANGVLGRVDDVCAVTTTFHLAAQLAASLAEVRAVPGPSPASIALALDKAQVRARLDEVGLPNLAAVVLGPTDAAPTQLRYPVVAKPVNGFGKVGAAICADGVELSRHLHEFRRDQRTWRAGVREVVADSVIVEELAVGDLYSAEIVADASNRQCVLAVRRKTGALNPILELGSTVPALLPPTDLGVLMDYATDVCAALGLSSGVFHVEVMWTASGPRLIEVNPRIAGGAIPDLIGSCTGESLFEALVATALGRPAPQAPWVARHAVSHTFLAAAERTLVRPDLDQGWFAKYLAEIDSGWSTLRPGTRLEAMSGNFDPFGVVRVRDTTPAAAEARCVELLDRIEDELRFPLVRPSAR
jgi:biotin carboxylase